MAMASSNSSRVTNPPRDTRTQLYVGNVRPILSSSELPFSLRPSSYCLYPSSVGRTPAVFCEAWKARSFYARREHMPRSATLPAARHSFLDESASISTFCAMLHTSIAVIVARSVSDMTSVGIRRVAAFRQRFAILFIL